jgi:hypothetical protein
MAPRHPTLYRLLFLAMGEHQFVFAVFNTLLVTSRRGQVKRTEKPPVKTHFYTVVGARQHYSHSDYLLVQLGLKTGSEVAICSCMIDL